MRSPMPGTVVAVAVTAGDSVVAGDPLVMVEAMKMEHTLTAPTDGVVAEVTVKAGVQVALDEVLAVVRPNGADGTAATADAEVDGAGSARQGGRP